MKKKYFYVITYVHETDPSISQSVSLCLHQVEHDLEQNDITSLAVVGLGLGAPFVQYIV
jgi:hypothetical protein